LNSKVGIVVPTLGQRPEYLDQSLNSIQNAVNDGNLPFVVLVAPSSFDASKYLAEGKVNLTIQDNGLGLADAINSGFSAMPSQIEYMNWLGDDDMLSPGSLSITSSYLDRNPRSVLVFGSCDYIDRDGNLVWKNSSGPHAVPLLRFGPDLIPQPGALFRKNSFWDVRGLDTKYAWAFDFDLFIKLSKIGKLSYLKSTLSSFRWHPESLSVEHRRQSVGEASAVRVSHLPKIIQPLSILWEFTVREATLIAGNKVTARAKKKKAKPE
jgi:glycosyltransferase involved in cell wall biosynthesis